MNWIECESFGRNSKNITFIEKRWKFDFGLEKVGKSDICWKWWELVSIEYLNLQKKCQRNRRRWRGWSKKFLGIIAQMTASVLYFNLLFFWEMLYAAYYQRHKCLSQCVFLLRIIKKSVKWIISRWRMPIGMNYGWFASLFVTKKQFPTFYTNQWLEGLTLSLLVFKIDINYVL